jgi:hypothetical protein
MVREPSRLLGPRDIASISMAPLKEDVSVLMKVKEVVRVPSDGGVIVTIPGLSTRVSPDVVTDEALSSNADPEISVANVTVKRPVPQKMRESTF